MVSNIAFSLVVSLSLIWLCDLSFLYMWKHSSVSINLPFLVTWTTSIISSIGPMACLLSIRCWANFDLLLLYLKSCRFSWNLTLNGRPVCPVYFILQLGHVNWYIPLLSYLFWGASCFKVRRFPILSSVVNAIFTLVSLNNFIINLVSLPTYANFAHLFN